MITQLETVRYVTSHFQALQGLRLVPFGLFCLAAAFGSAAWTSWSDFAQGDWTAGTYIFLLTLFLLSWLVARYYRRRFGMVVQDRGWDRATILFGVALFVAVGLDTSFGLPVSFFMLVIAAGVAYEGLDGSRRYGHVLLGGVLAAFALWPLFFGSAHFAMGYGVVGVGLVLVGVHDHLLLVRALRAVRQPQERHG